MKKVLSIIVVVAIIMSVMFAGTSVAMAEDVVDWNASLSPSSLSTGGIVTFSSSIKNVTSNPITDVVIIYPDGSKHQVAGGTIAAGASESYTDNNYSVATDQLGKDLQFTLSCNYTNSAGEKAAYQKYATGKVTKKAGKVSVTGSTAANKTTVDKAGDKVTFTFTFKNTGDTEVTDCRLFAPPINDGKEITQKPFSLAAGASKTLNYTSAISKDTTVSPKLTFTADGKSQSISTNTVEVKVKGSDPEPTPTPTPEDTSAIEISAVANQNSVIAGDDVEITVTVDNAGLTSLSDIVVTDNNDKEISLSKTKLEIGESATGKATYTINENSSFQFDVAALDSAGQIITGTSSVVKITLSEIDVPEEEKGLFIDVIADSQNLEKAGEVTFTILVTNNSDIELSNVVVSEATTGEIATIPTLVNDSKEIQHKINVEKTSNYVFTVQAQLADGSVVSATTDPVTITVADAGPDMMAVIIGIIVVAVVVLVVVLLVLRNKKKKNKNNGGGGAGGNQRTYDGNPRQREAYSQKQYEYNRPMRQRAQQNDGMQMSGTRPSSSFAEDANSKEYSRQNKNDYDFTVESEPTLSSEEPVAPPVIPTGSTRRALNIEPQQNVNIPKHESKKRGDRNNF